MAHKPRTKLRYRFHDTFLPHEGNRFRPLLFTLGGIASVLVLIGLLHAAYFVQTKLVFTETDFLASVLPGVLVSLANEDRAAAGKGALAQDAQLARAAQLKAEDMAANGYFAHVDPQGRQPWYWLDEVGYEYGYAGENLAVNFTDSEDVQEAWMNSPTHHANLVKAEYTRIGIGVARGMYKGNETTFVVQFFATPKVASAQAAPDEKADDRQASEEPVSAASVAGEEPKPADEAPASVSAENVAEAEQQPVAAVSEVAGASVEGAKGFLAQVAASPTHTLMYALAALAALFSVATLAALMAHLKVAYVEVLGGGLVVLLVAVSLLAYHATAPLAVEIPADAQPAAVINAF